MPFSRPRLFAAAFAACSAAPIAHADIPDAGARPNGDFAMEQPALVTHAALGFSLPPGFRASVFHQGIEEQRAMAMSSDGVLYVIREERGWFGKGLVALKDEDGDGVADRVEEFGGFAGSGIATHVDETGQEWLYASSRTEVFRWPLAPGDLAPSGRRERIVHGFLNNGREHPWKPMTFDGQGNMYVMVGAPSNACMEQRRTKGSPGQEPCPQLERQAGIWKFDADEPDQHQRDGERWATGVRNMLQIDWSEEHQAIAGASHGRDFLNRYFPDLFDQRDDAELPSEQFHLVSQGEDLGWPYAYYDHEAGEMRWNPEYEPVNLAGRGRNRAAGFEGPTYGFPGHWAPFGAGFYTHEGEGAFPDIWRRGAFVVFKGGWGRNVHPPQAGYRVSFVPLSNGELSDEPVVFAGGFEGPRPDDYPADQPFPAGRYDGAHAPMFLAFGPDGALYLNDQRQLKIWRISYEGDALAAADLRTVRARAEAGVPAAPIIPADFQDDRPLGQRLYESDCAACHGRDGRGVENFAPNLHRSRLLAGDPVALSLDLLRGNEQSDDWYIKMDPYLDGPHDDAELAAIFTYARDRFTQAGPVEEAEVTRARERLER
ncbi:MAG: c-type cytochrome [Oceanicaulis sp.]